MLIDDPVAIAQIVTETLQTVCSACYRPVSSSFPGYARCVCGHTHYCYKIAPVPGYPVQPRYAPASSASVSLTSHGEAVSV